MPKLLADKVDKLTLTYPVLSFVQKISGRNSLRLLFFQGLHRDRQHDVRAHHPDGHHAGLHVPAAAADAGLAHLAHLHLGAGAQQEEEEQEHHHHAHR